MEKTTDRLKFQIILRILFWCMALVIILTIAIAWWQYPESYEFLQETVSALGGELSDTGLANNTSSMIMMIGFGVSGVIALTISIIYFVKFRLRYNIIKAILSLTIAVGVASIAIPRDHPQLRKFHYIGAAVFLLSFGILNFVCQALRYIRKHRPQPNRRKLDYWLDIVFVFLVFLSCILFLSIYLLEHFSIDTSFLTVALTQKITLIIYLIAISLLNINDM